MCGIYQVMSQESSTEYSYSFEKLFSLSLDVLYIVGSDGYFKKVNPAFQRIMGYSEEEFISKPFLDYIHPDDMGSSLEAFKKVKEGEALVNFVNRYRDSSGKYHIFSWTAAIEVETGLIYGAARDVTNQSQIEGKLKKTLHILNETNSIAKIGGWELDVVSGELTWTDETFNILEVEKRLDQKPILHEGLELFTPEYKPVIENAVNRAIQFGESYSLEVEASTAKGNILWVYTNGKANYIDGKIVSLSGTIQDIHKRKIAEMHYEEERLKNIHNFKLASMGEMAAGVAHEINNPLSIISAAAQLMAKFINQPDKLTAYIDEVLKSTHRISRIVLSLKKFSRTSDTHEFESHLFKNIIDEAIILTEAKSKRHNVTVSVESTSNPMVLCDEVEIEQVIVNLINNSIDAIKDSNDKRWVLLEFDEVANDVMLKITDSGKGIAIETKEKLFDPFYTTKGTGEGTGLGLSITKGILEEHKASISLDESCDNTCFIITFPKNVS